MCPCVKRTSSFGELPALYIGARVRNSVDNSCTWLTTRPIRWGRVHSMPGLLGDDKVQWCRLEQLGRS